MSRLKATMVKMASVSLWKERGPHHHHLTKIFPNPTSSKVFGHRLFLCSDFLSTLTRQPPQNPEPPHRGPRQHPGLANSGACKGLKHPALSTGDQGCKFESHVGLSLPREWQEAAVNKHGVQQLVA